MVKHPQLPLSLPHFPLFPELLVLVALALALSSCAAASPSLPPISATITPTPAPSLTPTPPATAGPASCAPPPVVTPTLPSPLPGYLDRDPSTGLHVTGRYTGPIDLQAYRLEVAGLVDHPLRLSYDDLRCMPRVEAHARLVCPGFFEDEGDWAGASLAYILDLAGVQAGATQLYMTAADGYETHLVLEKARRDSNFLAYTWEGEPLPALHGFPVRAVFPGEYGAMWVKGLVKLEVK